MAISRTAKIILGIAAGVIVLSAGGVTAFALLSSDSDSSASSRERRASGELPQRASVDREQLSSDEGRTASAEVEDQTRREAEKRQAAEVSQPQTSTSPPEVTGECPTATSAVYSGTTSEFSVRICQGAAQDFTYVGGNSTLGFIVLPASIGQSGSGTAFFARNGSTSYTVSADGLSVAPPASEAWTQIWQSGNMATLR